MGRRNEKAGLMKQRNGKTDSCVFRRARPPQKRHLHIGMMLYLGLLAMSGHAVRAQALNPTPQVPKPLSINVAKPLTEPLQYQFPGKEPQLEIELEFNGNGRDWSFVSFDKLPPNISLRAKDQLVGYSDSEVIRGEKWYWLKNKLPLVLKITSGPQSALNISFWFGSPKNDGERERANQMLPTEIRAFTESHDFERTTQKQTLALTWDAAPGASPTSTSSPLASSSVPSSQSTTSPEAGGSWFTYLTYEDPLVGIFVVLVILIVLGIFIVFGLPNIRYRLERRKQRRQKKLHSRKKDHTSPVDSLGLESGEPAPQHLSAPKTGDATNLRKGNTPGNDRTGEHGRPQTDLPPRLYAGDVVLPSPKALTGPSFGQPSGQSFTAEVKRLENLLKSEVTRLRETLDEKVNRHQQEKLLAAVADLENKLRRSEERLDQRLKTATTQLEGMGIDAASQMETTRAELTKQVNEADMRGAQAKEELVGLLKGVIEDVKSVDKRLQTRLSEVQTALSLQTVPDSFFNKTLGAVLGQNVETLQDGNFERLIGEKLNQFFETGIEHGEKLQEVRARAEEINSALKAVSVQMERLNAQASVEARQPIQQFEAFVNELSGLQSQMQTRRAIIETIVHVPVSLHAGARQTFLDELGRGIRREIDKLNDPQKYFEGEMDRLITTDLIAIVDICDKTVAPLPGRPELESALKLLFEQAGLRAILPHQGEAFKTAEQDLIEMAQGSGKSLTVAQVITRGFYYKHRDNETLLRKAGVMVYR